MLTLMHKDQLSRRGFTPEQIQLFEGSEGDQWILRSLTPEEVQKKWLDPFPSMRGVDSGALLLRFNETTFSLKPDNLVIDGDRKKYLYMKSDSPGRNTQPWVPLGQPVIATEGLFDALAATYLMDTPCCAATAPSHLGRSQFPESVKIYVSDADVPFHHSESLFFMVVGMCRKRQLKLSHLPRNPSANYRFENKIPQNCKWGMEEWAREWGSDAPRELQKIIDNALPPVAYMKSVFREYECIGLRYPENEVTIANAARAIADATSRKHERQGLRDLLKKCTGASKQWIDGLIEKRDRRIQQKERGSEQTGVQHLSSEPLINKNHPTKAELQSYIQNKYLIRFNQLTQLIELNGQPMDEIDLADQWLANIEGIEVRKQTAKDAFDYLGRCNPYNPIKEYLLGLRQKNNHLRLVPIDEIASVFAIKNDDQLSKELLARHLVGHIVRGLDPENSKHQQMLILYGLQGTGKSRTIAAIVGSAWFDSATVVKKGGLEDWNFLPKVNSVWAFEFDECEKVIRSTTAAEFKGFVTRTSDNYTEKFKSHKKSYPRRSCLWGTTNDPQVLNDPTGTRRFWVVPTEDRFLDPSWFIDNRDSFWATVMTWHDWGLQNWIDPTSSTAKAATERSQQVSLSDPLELQLREALESHNHYRVAGVSQANLLRRHLDTELVRASRDLQMRITRIITSTSFLTHDGSIRWRPKKKRFKDLNGRGVLVQGPSLHGYVPQIVDPSFPTNSCQVGTVQLPWDNSDLVKVFQPFHSN